MFAVVMFVLRLVLSKGLLKIRAGKNSCPLHQLKGLALAISEGSDSVEVRPPHASEHLTIDLVLEHKGLVHHDELRSCGLRDFCFKQELIKVFIFAFVQSFCADLVQALPKLKESTLDLRTQSEGFFDVVSR